MTVYHQSDQPGPLYKNPTFPRSFPDPFVLKHGGEYFAYCTGHWTDGRVFGILRSNDLVEWHPIGGAMDELEQPEPFYWAPEITYWNGTFYLYYSAGNETLMHLRVATSDRPDGGFRDAGVRLTREDFAIDAHVFTDDDGQRYLFYATDFLEHTHIGTGIVMDRMLNWLELAGEPRPVVRAKYDWQVYDPARREKGGVRWHTVEGPFVLKRKGRYFLMFSGGNWQRPTYGVSFALSGVVQASQEWRQFCDGNRVMPILRTDGDKQIGPGHNSVIRGPNNRDLYCVYHYWHEGDRVLAVNRMDFAGPRIFVEDRPYLEKTVPLQPSSHFKLERENWEGSDAWDFSGGTVGAAGEVLALLRSSQLPESFLCEFDFRVGNIGPGGVFGFRLEGSARTLVTFSICRTTSGWAYEWEEGGPQQNSLPLTLGNEFRADVLNRVTIEVNQDDLCIRINDDFLAFSAALPSNPECLTLFSEGAEAYFSGLSLTPGFEDLFDSDVGESREIGGWSAVIGEAQLSVRHQELRFRNREDHDAVIAKGSECEDFDFAANIRLKGPAEPGGRYGFVLLGPENFVLARFEFEDRGGRSYLVEGQQDPGTELPADFNTRAFFQFRFRKRSDRLYLDLETRELGFWQVDPGKARMGFIARKSTLAVEMVRLTLLS